MHTGEYPPFQGGRRQSAAGGRPRAPVYRGNYSQFAPGAGGPTTQDELRGPAGPAAHASAVPSTHHSATRRPEQDTKLISRRRQRQKSAARRGLTRKGAKLITDVMRKTRNGSGVHGEAGHQACSSASRAPAAARWPRRQVQGRLALAPGGTAPHVRRHDGRRGVSCAACRRAPGANRSPSLDGRGHRGPDAILDTAASSRGELMALSASEEPFRVLRITARGRVVRRRPRRRVCRGPSRPSRLVVRFRYAGPGRTIATVFPIHGGGGAAPRGALAPPASLGLLLVYVHSREQPAVVLSTRESRDSRLALPSRCTC